MISISIGLSQKTVVLPGPRSANHKAPKKLQNKKTTLHCINKMYFEIRHYVFFICCYLFLFAVVFSYCICCCVFISAFGFFLHFQLDFVVCTSGPPHFDAPLLKTTSPRVPRCNLAPLTSCLGAAAGVKMAADTGRYRSAVSKNKDPSGLLISVIRWALLSFTTCNMAATCRAAIKEQ